MGGAATTQPAAEATHPAAEFVEFFAEGWRIGALDPERFFAHFAPRLTPDALLEQPLSPAFRGPRGLRQLFEPLFEAIPDLRGEVVRWGATHDGVLIELRLSGRLGGRPVEWISVDRIVLRDAQVAERRAYFDPLPLVAAMLMRPRVAARLLPKLWRRKGKV